MEMVFLSGNTFRFKTNLMKDEVLNWFGDKDQFIKIHLEKASVYFEEYFSIEE